MSHRFRIGRAAGALILAAFAAGALAAGPPVTVAEAKTAPIVELVHVNGTVTSPQSAVLSPSVAGLIETMDVDAGDRVDAGDVIVALDRELEQLALQRAQAEAAQAAATLGDARRRLGEAEKIGPTRAIAESAIKSLRAEVARAEAGVRAADAAVAQQRAVVRRHTVRAPFAGVVSRRIAEVGEWVNPGDGLVELVATDRLRFDFRVPQSHYAQLDRATPVDVRVDAVAGTAIPGRVQAIVPVKDPGARTFLLRVVADAADTAAVTPGMSAQGTLRIDAQRSGVVVPRDALLRYQDGRTTVWIVDDTGGEATVRERRIGIGVEYNGLIEVRSGLDAGAAVVTRGNEVLRDGQAVTVR
ncbi:MAG: efflux RND transporter periplasmic adaptor subunit [Proteobacteria bacterium]|nr:efflux RND transporter periplasmic adaptor subunit [Pseudomonadota bacterium]